MLGTLESIGEEDITVTFLRHMIISLYGPTREREVYDKVRSTINSPARAIQFLDMLVDGAQIYAALLNPDHSRWNSYGTTTRRHVKTLLNLRLEQIRPLSFAVASRFEPEELKRASDCFSLGQYGF